MAKKETGPSNGLIITLVFFVLATFIAGTVAYFGYAEVEDYKKKAAEAEKKAKEMEAYGQDQEARRLLLRIAFGNARGDDRDDFKHLVDNGRAAAAMEEFKDLGNLSLGSKQFVWNKTEGDKLDVAPQKSISELIKEVQIDINSALSAKREAEDSRNRADQAREQAIRDLDAEKTSFRQKIKEVEGQKEELRMTYNKRFEGFVTELDKKANENQDEKRKCQALEDQLRKDIDFLTKKRDELIQLVKKYEGQRESGPDLARLDQKKGSVDRRDGSFVYIDLGAAHYLRPQTTFTILPADGVWRNVEERERQIKGQIEVIEVLGPYSARAKILNEVSPIRDPIRPKDQLFNLTFTPGAQEHVAFAGIIDLNGDGLDDNLDFIRFMEKQGVIIDQWLDLRDRQIKGKGMTLQTKFLVMGPRVEINDDDAQRKNDPRVAAKQEIQAQMGRMQEEARKLGVQVIDYRKFLAMIGYKVPERPAPAEYGSSAYLRRGDGQEKPMDEGSDSAPPPPPKKDNGR